MPISDFFRREHHPREPKPTKAHRHAARLSTTQLYDWGSQVALYAAQLLEKHDTREPDHLAELLESAEALLAVHYELSERAAA